MLVDANLLLFAVTRRSPFHERAQRWLDAELNGVSRIGLPWAVLLAFVRVITNPRATRDHLDSYEAWDHVEQWLDAPTTWIPLPTPSHQEVLGKLVRNYQLAGDLIMDADLAALAIQHGLTIASADTDFARFTEIRWVNPLAS